MTNPHWAAATFRALCLDCLEQYAGPWADAWEWMEWHEASSTHACRMTALPAAAAGERAPGRRP